MIFNETEEQEREYLQQVLNTIHDTINSTDKSVKEHIDTLQEYKDYLYPIKISILMRSVPCVKVY